MDKRGSDIPHFDDLVKFIRDQIKILQRTSFASSRNHECTKKSFDRRMDAPSKSFKSTHTYVNTTNATSQPSCSLCNIQHEHLYKCPGFQKLSPNERFKFVKSNSYCVNCLSKNHRASHCNSNTPCHKCQQKHHTLLHFENKNVASTVSTHAGVLSVPVGRSSAVERSSPPHSPLPPHTPQPRAASAADNVTMCTLSDNDNKVISPVHTTVLLATARVLIVDAQGDEHCVRALLDSASQSNFITRKCCYRLGLNPREGLTCPMVRGIGGSAKNTQGSVQIKFFSRFNRRIEFDMESLVIDKVTERLPTVKIDVELLSNLKNLPLADDTYDVPGDIDLLIGASIFPHLLLPNRIKGEPANVAPLALETVLGYVIVGTAPAMIDTYSTVSYCCASPIEQVESVVRKFWELEEVDVPPILSPEDKECEDIYTHTTTRDDDGRYFVALPFKGDVFSLGDSRRLAEKCFLCLERKMLASPKLKQAYDSVIKEYLDNGYISPALPQAAEDNNAPSYIIPHHGVLREDKLTSKLRIVLNASAKTSTCISLNDILHSGQNLQGDLFNIIVDFRLFSVALSADIRQMFHCIAVRESDRRFLRILYRFTPDEPIQVYQFNRVCFGLKSSPFHALRTIKQLATDEGASYPKARETVQSSLYMDDYVYSVDSENEAISTAAEVIALMKAGQFDLVKWTSNSQSVLESIPQSHRLSSVKEFAESESHKVLGLCWSPNSDLFGLKICTPAEKCTKRTILSCVARLWDLMGFVAPVILYAKLVIKELWLIDCDWDDAPPENIVALWLRFREELPMLEQIRIPRHVDIAKTSVVTIIGFADASEKAYGGVVYFHVCNNGVNTVHLISAKSKVAPRKIVSLARLELCAAFLLTKLINNIINACNNRHPINEVYVFSDSTVALCWIHGSPHRWDTFVANRVSKIQSLLSPLKFHHVSGTENPADCLSRGLTPSQIIDHPLWFHGPLWTRYSTSEWPIATFNPSTVSDPPEEKKHSFASSVEPEEPAIIALANRVSSWSKLLRCIVYVYRFIKMLPSRDFITASDLEYAEHKVLRELQANIKSLKTHLFRVIGEQVLSFEEMSTVLVQIEAIMNTRPLCRTLTSDPSEPLALTPAHFLNLTPLKYLPAINIDEDRLHVLSRHALLDKLVQSFWKRWRSEYLHTLQSRDKWNTPTNPITVGTVVVLNTENVPPLHWPLGLVEEVFPASDGVVRVARVRTRTGSYLRPVIRLCPLPKFE